MFVLISRRAEYFPDIHRRRVIRIIRKVSSVFLDADTIFGKEHIYRLQRYREGTSTYLGIRYTAVFGAHFIINTVIGPCTEEDLLLIIIASQTSIEARVIRIRLFNVCYAFAGCISINQVKLVAIDNSFSRITCIFPLLHIFALWKQRCTVCVLQIFVVRIAIKQLAGTIQVHFCQNSFSSFLCQVSCKLGIKGTGILKLRNQISAVDSSF